MTKINVGDPVEIFMKVVDKDYTCNTGVVSVVNAGWYAVDLGVKSASSIGGTVKVPDRNIRKI